MPLQIIDFKTNYTKREIDLKNYNTFSFKIIQIN